MTTPRDRDFVNVDTELGYWQTRFDNGALIGDSFFKDCRPVIKLACDIYVRNPHGSRSAWLVDLDSHLPDALNRDQRKISGQIAELCWSRLLF
ncbi:hypothetical protein [Stenotrophomonas sp. NLF4-10]|uniref:hypothetical protein n=1 Tax=Stenotrophomonas sp. NLF4-10 TaxID=2918754 RepID=UPI001EFBCCD5|nr:hypothetical protein [Stenotrophomonas sp. NLF4-10]MCG8276907.1 hypothetical protein [Stenotrophomonas sp. NLF4-10]